MQSAFPIKRAGGIRQQVRTIFILASSTLAVLLFAGCNMQPAPNASQPGVPVEQGAPQTAEVSKRDVVEQIPLNAELIVPPTATASLSEPFHSKVERVFKSVGEYVRAGEPVLELEIPDAEVYREQARLNLKQAETDYANAKQLWDPRMTDAKRTVAQANEAVQQAKKAASTAGTDSDSGTLTSASDVSGTTPAVDEALEQRRQAERDLAQLQVERRQELLPYTQRIAEARAALNQAKASDDAGKVKAPKSGTIVTLNAQPGQMVDGDRNTPVVQVINLDQIQILAPMTPEQANRVKEGMAANLSFDEAPDKVFDGRVKRITTRTNSKDYVAVISFVNKGYLIKPGFHPHVGIKTGRAVENEPAVPADAVDVEKDNWVVQVRRNNEWVKVPVTPGVSDGKFTTIKSGVKEGDVVLVTAGR